MSDNDATHRRRRVAEPLREFVDANWPAEYETAAKMRDCEGTVPNDLLRLADQIDREHERRMEQQSYELRKAFCRYLGGVIDDYRHGMKRKRLRK